jgi:hypothetical protein
MRKSIRPATLHATTFMINRYQDIRPYGFNTARQGSELLAIGKVSAKQNDTPSGGMLNTAAVVWSEL